MRAACRRAGIPYGDRPLDDRGRRVGVVFHGLRRFRITRWVEMGFSDEIVRMASGHAPLEAYRTYPRLDGSSVMRLVMRAGNPPPHKDCIRPTPSAGSVILQPHRESPHHSPVGEQGDEAEKRAPSPPCKRNPYSDDFRGKVAESGRKNE